MTFTKSSKSIRPMLGTPGGQSVRADLDRNFQASLNNIEYVDPDRPGSNCQDTQGNQESPEFRYSVGSLQYQHNEFCWILPICWRNMKKLWMCIDLPLEVACLRPSRIAYIGACFQTSFLRLLHRRADLAMVPFKQVPMTLTLARRSSCVKAFFSRSCHATSKSAALQWIFQKKLNRLYLGDVYLSIMTSDSGSFLINTLHVGVWPQLRTPKQEYFVFLHAHLQFHECFTLSPIPAQTSLLDDQLIIAVLFEDVPNAANVVLKMGPSQTGGM